MYINKKIDLRGSFPYLANESFKNNLNKKERRGLTNSLSMNNIYLLPHTTRQFGKEMKNIMNLTVNPDSLQANVNIEEKIKYYRKLNDDLTNILNNYDKNFFGKNNKIIHKIININVNEKEKVIIKSNEKYVIPCSRNDKSKKCKKIIIEKENKENKENKDNNICYFENNNEKEHDKLIKKNKDSYMEKIVNLDIINEGINISVKANCKLENKKKEEMSKEYKDNNIIVDKNSNKKKSNKQKSLLSDKNTKDEVIQKSNIIQKNNDNPQEVNEYFDEIFNDIQIRENNELIDPNYLKNTQKFINHKMRAILIDWLIDVHKKYKLKPETMYLTVNIIDRYLSKKNVETINLQLVGVVALLIASKYEDIRPPLVKELAEITDGAYVKNQLISMENKMLSCLNFDLLYPTQWHFLECYKKKLNLNEITFCFSWYLMEMALIDINIINYKGSIIAASACMISLKYFKKFNEQELENATGYKEKNLENCAKDMKFLWINNKNEKNLSAIRRKFSQTKFFEVSKIKYDNL